MARRCHIFWPISNSFLIFSQAGTNAEIHTMERMLVLLEDYINLLQETEAGSRPIGDTSGHGYHIPADTLSEAEWAEFDNVYQIHCPKIFLDSAIRDVRRAYTPHFWMLTNLTDYDAILLLF